MLKKMENLLHTERQDLGSQKRKEENGQVYICPLPSFPLRKYILLLADCGGQYVCCTLERGLLQTPPGLQTKEYTTVTSKRGSLDILSHKHAGIHIHI